MTYEAVNDSGRSVPGLREVRDDESMRPWRLLEGLVCALSPNPARCSRSTPFHRPKRRRRVLGIAGRQQS